MSLSTTVTAWALVPVHERDLRSVVPTALQRRGELQDELTEGGFYDEHRERHTAK